MDQHVKDPEGRDTRVWLDIDKNRGQIRLEIITKHALAALKDFKAEAAGALRCRRNEGSVSVEWTPLLRIIVNDEEKFTLKWNEAALEKRGWIKQELEDATRLAIAAATPAVRWG